MQLTTGKHKEGWWLPDDAQRQSGAAVRAGGGSGGAAEADAVMQLAAMQRMNTDGRRGIFCILMSADDYVRFFIVHHQCSVRGIVLCRAAAEGSMLAGSVHSVV